MSWTEDRTTADLSRQIRNRQCGGCGWWMTKACPKEKSDMSGYSKGPNSGGYPCSKFNDNPRREEIKEELVMRKLHENL